MKSIDQRTDASSSLAFVCGGSSPADLERAMYRVAWYGRPFLDSGFDLVLTAELLDFAEGFDTAGGIADPAIADSIKLLCRQARRVESLKSLADMAVREVICLDRSSYNMLSQAIDSIDLIDVSGDQFEASRLAYLHGRYLDGPKCLFPRALAKFAGLRGTLEAPRYKLVATGPSMDDVDFASIKGATDKVIVANSAILNVALMEALRPEIVVCSDPVFHAGFSRYAGIYREELVKAIRKYSAVGFVPARDYHLYEAFLPADVVERIIPLWFGAEVPRSSKALSEACPSLELPNTVGSALTLYTTGNVLTNFMMQLARTFCGAIDLYGCDGREPEANDYFWSHGKTVQINDEMTNVQECHPSFFDTDFDDYYRTHIEQLRSMLWVLRAEGMKIRCQTPTLIPPLLSSWHSPDPSKETVDVSVIMPAFNAADTLADSARSVLLHSDVRLELLIIDDGSSDDTAEICKLLAANDSRVVYVRQENSGVSHARNAGLERSTGKRVAFLDADDRYVRNGLRSLYQFAIESGEPLVYGRTKIVNEHKQAIGNEIGKGDKILDYAVFQRGYHIHTSGVLIDRDVAMECRFPESRNNGEDLSYFVDLARRGFRYVPCGELVTHYVWRSGSTTHSSLARHSLRVFDVLGDVFREFVNHPFYPEGNQGIDESLVDLQRARILCNAIFLLEQADRTHDAELLAAVVSASARLNEVTLELSLNHFDSWWNRCDPGRRSLGLIGNQAMPVDASHGPLRARLFDAAPDFYARYYKVFDDWLNRRSMFARKDLILVQDEPVTVPIAPSRTGCHKIGLHLKFFLVRGALEAQPVSDGPSDTYPPIAFTLGPFVAMLEHDVVRVDCKLPNGTLVNRFATLAGWNGIRLTIENGGYKLIVNGKEIIRDVAMTNLEVEKLVIGGGFKNRLFRTSYVLKRLEVPGDATRRDVPRLGELLA